METADIRPSAKASFAMASILSTDLPKEALLGTSSSVTTRQNGQDH